jgi:chloride channel protein, CIC family
MMEVADLMERRVVTVSANDYAMEALSLMREKGLSELLVVDRNEVVGYVERRILECQMPRTLAERDVREYMNPHVTFAEPDTSADEADWLMRRDSLPSLPVMENRRLQGVVTRRSLNRSSRRPRAV